MSEDFDFSTAMPSDEMAQYMQMYLDETAEQLDALVESLLVLETRPTDAEQLNEAFRLIHSIKGSSAMMGLDGVTVLTHHLENHFERLRSGVRELDQSAMELILRCIDFLREYNRRLRDGESLASAPDLLDELNGLSSSSSSVHAIASGGVQLDEPAPDLSSDEVALVEPSAAAETILELSPPETHLQPQSKVFRILVRFEAELALAELKAELVLARVARIASVMSTLPPQDEFETVVGLRFVQILLSTTASPSELRAAADVDGVEFIEIEEVANEFAPSGATVSGGIEPVRIESVKTPEKGLASSGAAKHQPAAAKHSSRTVDKSPSSTEEDDAIAETAGAQEVPSKASTGPPVSETKTKVAETVRVDIERLDKLMNLTGELVVNKSRFVQIARQMSPAFKKSGLSGRARSISESMRQALQLMKSRCENETGDSAGNGQELFHELESEIDALEEQAKIWEDSRRSFVQITEAIDQMTRVSDSLQRGVLDTRMVPVAPLFNRFKRVVRDIALDLGKKVNLEIHGEKTELDKRMIDELGDPLVHLVRNAIDHGIEAAEVRSRRGKSEIGTIRLEAAHSGNNVLISVRDDGEGINIERVRERIVHRGLTSAAIANSLSDREVIEYIWSPGFSTAEVVSDISGRGVGMDIVKTRISELNGTIDIGHAAGRGTTFTIRLPLTLAIIRSMLFRLRHGMFAVPIDNVREIVSVAVDEIISIRGRQTIDVRGKWIPLVDIDDIFDWHTVQYSHPGSSENAESAPLKRVNVVVLHSGDKTMGLKVDELQGGQDIVIKSLAENYIHIRGLSGASILGDGSVCLLFDVGTAISMAISPRKPNQKA